MVSDPIRTVDQLDVPLAPTRARAALPLPNLRPLLAWIMPPLIALLLLAIGVEIWARATDVSIWVMPRPTAVIEAFVSDFGLYFQEGLLTTGVSLAGLAVGTATATIIAAGVAHSQLLERAVLPIAIMVKVTPVVALIPLFIIWLGHSVEPKIAIAALITYFPVLVNAIAGFRDVDPRMHDFFRSVDASTWEIFRHLRLPAAVPFLFASLKISVTLSLIGAVVAEFFLSGQGGLGALIWIEQNNLRLERVFAAVLMLTLIGVTLSTAVVAAERVFSWRLDQPVAAS